MLVHHMTITDFLMTHKCGQIITWPQVKNQVRVADIKWSMSASFCGVPFVLRDKDGRRSLLETGVAPLRVVRLQGEELPSRDA